MQLREHAAIARRRAARTELDAALRSGRAHPSTLERLRRAAFDLDSDMVIQPMGQAGAGAGPTPPPPALPGLVAFLSVTQGLTIVDTLSGAGDSLGYGNSTLVSYLADATAGFGTTHHGQRLTITGATTPGYNGSFFARPSGTVAPAPAVGPTCLAFGLASQGATPETFPGTWTLDGRISQAVDLQSGLVFSQTGSPLARPRAVNDIAPGFTLWGADPYTAWGAYLELVDATVAGQLVSNANDLCCVSRGRHGSSASGWAFARVDDGTTANRIAFDFSTSTTVRCVWAGSGVSTTAATTMPSIATNTWFTHGFRLNRTTGWLSYYRDGVLQSSNGPATVRLTPGLTRIIFGSPSSNSAQRFNSAFMLAAANWTDADFLAAHNLILAQGGP